MTSLDALLTPAPAATDAELFAAATHRPQVLAEVFDRHAPALLRYLTRRIGAADAEDLLNDVFVVVIERRGSFDAGAASARPWLFGIASNLVARRHRDETRHLRALERGERADGSRFEDAAAARVDADRAVRRLAGALAALSAGDRDVLLLTAWAGLEQREVATALDVPVGTVKSRLHRARGRLRDELGARDSDHDGGDR